ncbi:redox-regulated ATPase YchF [Candidatus Woesearchaeota archaeon]|jgi:ribosome-binding ATPase|nr:redox-regulated ATPase YchF [Candidatus Woesearchaeota archaeon]MBT4368589.1 redox-regulated ATPase YchF [Candidatus Woesearchaeota archaeon]MBT4713102.1 redox-regulated ATPase YchF [Candidatus Woesearchaeota archaeon]MBT6639024.1 redox-regulated ATPase YchF [Candidatus Woesearchaeota archaeon]MBT7134223.1 redox-regulated ATPase YchF [Candidatus Woesearchaeota archaeon]
MIIGVVGKPSVGKSTFFKAATLAEVDIANYPFTTIKPNEGVGFVKTEDAAAFFDKVSNPREGYVIDKTRFVPVQMIDVAGLVPGAHKGEGMGNQFLDDLRQADVLIHVIDVSGSTNEKGESIETGSYDPSNDIKFLEEELDQWYFGILKKGWERFARQVQQEHLDIKKALAKQLSGLKVDLPMMEDTVKKLALNTEKPIEWTEEQLFSLTRELRKLTKPMIIACNKADVNNGKENFEKLQKDFPDHLLIPCSAESEIALKEAAKHELIDYVPGANDFTIKGELNDKQTSALEFIKTHVLNTFNSTGVQPVLDQAVFSLLKYITIFPGGVNKLEDKNGNVLPDCFLMPPNTTALDFAYKLHTDFGKNFIRAIDVKTKQTIGKEHLLKSGDVVEIISGK